MPRYEPGATASILRVSRSSQRSHSSRSSVYQRLSSIMRQSTAGRQPGRDRIAFRKAVRRFCILWDSRIAAARLTDVSLLPVCRSMVSIRVDMDSIQISSASACSRIGGRSAAATFAPRSRRSPTSFLRLSEQSVVTTRASFVSSIYGFSSQPQAERLTGSASRGSRASDQRQVSRLPPRTKKAEGSSAQISSRGTSSPRTMSFGPARINCFFEKRR